MPRYLQESTLLLSVHFVVLDEMLDVLLDVFFRRQLVACKHA
jgi:hypothetical protein